LKKLKSHIIIKNREEGQPVKIVICLLFVLLFQTSLIADATEPGTYNECVLQKIRGQVKSTISRARRICESEFPFEKKLRGYDKMMEVKWWSTANTLHLAIQANHGDYRITRFNAKFATKPCGEIGGFEGSAYTLTREFVFDSEAEEASAHVGEDAEQYKCMRPAEIYGIKKNQNVDQ
jgi:hypothetical protein